jgi:tetratricopeptide (TPR) repeat protein
MSLLRSEAQPHEAVDILDRVIERDDITPGCRAHALRIRAISREDSESSLADLEQAIKLDPANPYNYHLYSNVLYSAGRLEEAAQRARQAVLLDPYMSGFYGRYADYLGLLGRREEMLEMLKKACQVGDTQTEWARYAQTLQAAGIPGDASAALQTAENREPTAQGQFWLAAYWAAREDRDRSLNFLRQSQELGLLAGWLPDAKNLSPFNTDPEFVEVLQRIRTQDGSR